MKGSDIIFDCANLLECRRISQNKFQTWWIKHRFFGLEKNINSAINRNKKKDNTCFQYAVTIAFIYEKDWKKPGKNNKN